MLIESGRVPESPPLEERSSGVVLEQWDGGRILGCLGIFKFSLAKSEEAGSRKHVPGSTIF